jgi:hypothetical protein
MYPPRNKKLNLPQIVENYENKKSAIINKLFDYFIKKNKNLSLEEFKLFLQNKITFDSLQNFDFNKFTKNIEKEYLNQLQKTKELSTENNNLESLTANLNKSRKDNDNLENNIANDHNNLISSPQSTISNEKRMKFEILKNIKEKDDWALIAKKDYEKFLEENSNKKTQESKIKSEMNNFLYNQMQEKKDQKYKKIEENKVYYKYIKQDYDEWIKQQENIQKQKHDQIDSLIKSIENFKKCNLI